MPLSIPPFPTISLVVALGVDDWAFRKGHTYGTILVDLESHEPVDLLPDRSTETLAQWLAAHPGVEIVSRDRAGAYAEGIRQGAPQAIQVADRFHLLQNLTTLLTECFKRHAALLDSVRRGVETPLSPLPTTTPAEVP